jgi:hypothetical protein
VGPPKSVTLVSSMSQENTEACFTLDYAAERILLNFTSFYVIFSQDLHDDKAYAYANVLLVYSGMKNLG